MTKYYNLFVYGTLKKQERAHCLLENSAFVCEADTEPFYEMYSCGSYPAIIESTNGNKIHGEIYLINQKTKEELDSYEGVSYGLYEFKILKIKNFPEDVYGYVFSGSVENWEKIMAWPCESNFKVV